MEPILEYLRRRLKEAGRDRWEAIARSVNESVADERERLSFHGLRKIAYGDRENPGVQTVQPLLDYFQAVEAGELELPEPSAAK